MNDQSKSGADCCTADEERFEAFFKADCDLGAELPDGIRARYPKGLTVATWGRRTDLFVPPDALVTVYVIDADLEVGAPCYAEGRITHSKGFDGEKAVAWLGVAFGWEGRD